MLVELALSKHCEHDRCEKPAQSDKLILRHHHSSPRKYYLVAFVEIVAFACERSRGEKLHALSLDTPW